MESKKCPECGESLRMEARKCRKCKTEIIRCSECGAVYKRGVSSCDMCGKELKRRGFKIIKKKATQDALAPDDLVSVINRIKAKSVSYKVLTAVKCLFAVVFCVALVLTLAVGLLAGELGTDLALMIARGESISEIGEYIISTPSRNFNIWTQLLKDVTRNDSSLSHALKFSGYLTSALFPPMLTVAVFYTVICLPMSVFNMLLCGAIAKKQGYNASDTIAIFERPTLIYNSKDSFNKAYTYFPYFERTQGRLWSLTAELLYYCVNVFCSILGVAVLVGGGLLKVGAHLVFELLRFPEQIINFLITLVAVFLVALYVVTVAVLIAVVKLVIRGIRQKQLKTWLK